MGRNADGTWDGHVTWTLHAWHPEIGDPIETHRCEGTDHGTVREHNMVEFGPYPKSVMAAWISWSLDGNTVAGVLCGGFIEPGTTMLVNSTLATKDPGHE